MTSVLSTVKQSVLATGETKKLDDLRHNISHPHGSDATEPMRSDHGTKIADPENWCVAFSMQCFRHSFPCIYLVAPPLRLRVVSENQTGPALLEDHLGREKIHRFDHERIPERVVHARGTGAHGFFRVHDDRLAKYTCAKVLTDPSRTTPVFVRFSTVQGSRGSADTGEIR